jgi:RNA polymerase sigma-70 factor (ECF subfamily)
LPTARDRILCELLILRCRRGDPAAPGELVSHFQRPLLYYLRRLVGNETDAWDAAQEAWMNVFRALDTLQNPQAFPAFLYRTARNAALTQLRKRRDVPDETALDAVSPAEAVDDALFAREAAERLHAALGRLSLPHRDVLTLHFLQDLSVAEIADVVGVPAGTVKSRIHHAKLALRDLLAERSER